MGNVDAAVLLFLIAAATALFALWMKQHHRENMADKGHIDKQVPEVELPALPQGLFGRRKRKPGGSSS